MPDEHPQPVLVLRPEGDLDLDSCGELRRQLASAFTAGVDVVGLDLSAIDLLDQSGLDLISGTARHLRKQGGDLRVVRASESVASTLRMNDLGHLLPPPLRLVRGGGLGGPRTRPRRLTPVPAEGLKLPG